MASIGDVQQIKRFFEKVKRSTDTLCWEWTGFKNNWGYGKVTVDGKLTGAHRASYEMFCGPIPADLIVRHVCDNPACVNPVHLELGTHADNAKDKALRGRVPTKLTNEQVISIRQSHISGTRLAAKYGVSTAAISLIRNNLRRQHTGG